jgi:hypothetical protein
LSRVFNETLNIISNSVNQSGKIFSETINIVSSFLIDNLSKVFYKTIKVEHSAVKSISRILTQSISIVSSTTHIFGRIFISVINIINPNVAKLTGRTLTETIKIG